MILEECFSPVFVFLFERGKKHLGWAIVSNFPTVSIYSILNVNC